MVHMLFVMLAAALQAKPSASTSPPPSLVFDAAAYTLRGSLGLKVKPNGGAVTVTGFTDLQASVAALRDAAATRLCARCRRNAFLLTARNAALL